MTVMNDTKIVETLIEMNGNDYVAVFPNGQKAKLAHETVHLIDEAISSQMTVKQATDLAFKRGDSVSAYALLDIAPNTVDHRVAQVSDLVYFYC